MSVYLQLRTSFIFLTADRKQQRINVLEELRQIASDVAALLSRVIAGEKTGIYGYVLETKQQSS
jgi:hypothetical protein